MKLPAASLSLFLFLASCSGAAYRAKRLMPGMSRSDVLSCAGIPDKSVMLDDREILQYEQTQSTFGNITAYSPSGLGVSVTPSGGCSVIITIQGGVVRAIKYKGPGNIILGPYADCVPVVRDCVG